MAADLEYVVGDTAPSLVGTLTDGTAPVDLTGCTVRFQMRLSSYATLSIDSAAVVVDAAAGVVRYDWGDHDLDMAGDYVARWRVYDTVGGTVEHTTPANTISVVPV